MNEQQLKAAKEIMQLEREGNVSMVSGRSFPGTANSSLKTPFSFPPVRP